MTRDARLAGLLLLPLIAGALFSLARFALEGADVPRDEDYRAARAVLDESGFVPGVDAVAVLPPWSLRAHQHLRGLKPVSGDLLEEVPLHRHRRLFLVVEPDADRWLDPALERHGAPSLEKPAGRLRVLVFDLGGAKTTYDFREHLFDAEVRVADARGQTRASCDRRLARGWGCQGRPSWQRATRQWLLVTENGEDAIWAHPPVRGEALELTWREVPLGDALVVRAGHTREGSDRAKAPVVVEVLIGGAPVARLERDVRFHYRTDVVDTSRFAGRRADVTLRVSTEDNGTNHFAIDAWAADTQRAASSGGAP